MATGRPAVVVVTSGTAAAELHASVVEADLARIPMLVCTADRPPELRDVGAPQTIDQHRLFGSAPRWFADPGVPDEGSRWSWRSLGSRAVAEAVVGPAGPGPVHLNLAFREPLLGDAAIGGMPDGRDDGGPWHRVDVAPPAPAPGLVEELVTSGGFVPGTRGLIVAGADCGDPDAVLALADALWWPVLADPRSGLRSRTAGAVAAADGILRSTGFAATHRPDVVLRLGGRWASKVVTTFLADLPSVAVEPYGWTDPERAADRIVRCDPTAFCRAITDAVATPGGGRSDRDAPWPSDWEARQSRADQVLWTELHRSSTRTEPPVTEPPPTEPPLTEPALAHRLFQGMPIGGTLVVSSSMPVRDIESFGSPRPDPPRVLANRGANGIDGVVSTALGVAVATGPTVAFVGDLAFLHDVSALVGPAGDRPALTVVVADNGGGGIFSFLPQADQLPADRFERLFATPQSADPAAVARGFGWDVVEIDGAGWSATLDATLDAALAPVVGGRVVVVRLPDRAANVAAHDRINAAIVAAVDSPGGTPPVPTG